MDRRKSWAFVPLLIVCGCGSGGGSRPTTQPRTVPVTIKFGLAKDYATRAIGDIDKIKVTISGTYMIAIVDTFDFNPKTETFSRTYSVPRGIDRLFHLDALDRQSNTIYQGETEKDVGPDLNVVRVDLYPSKDFGQAHIKLDLPNVPTSLKPIYGLNFSPYMDGQDPNLGTQISEQQIRDRLRIISSWCTGIRYFGSTRGNERIGPIAKDEFGLYVIAGAWLSGDEAENARQIANAVAVAQAGKCHALCVGSEVLLRGDLPAGDANSQPGDGTLIGYIKQVKQAVGVPVLYADTYAKLIEHPEVVNEVGVVFANVFPYWEGVAIDNALDHLKEARARLQRTYGTLIQIIISETGWPTAGNTIGQAVPSPANARRYFKQVVTWARREEAKLYWFEALDETWKAAYEGPQGAHWGIFTSDGAMKPDYHEVLF